MDNVDTMTVEAYTPTGEFLFEIDDLTIRPRELHLVGMIDITTIVEAADVEPVIWDIDHVDIALVDHKTQVVVAAIQKFMFRSINQIQGIYKRAKPYKYKGCLYIGHHLSDITDEVMKEQPDRLFDIKLAQTGPRGQYMITYPEIVFTGRDWTYLDGVFCIEWVTKSDLGDSKVVYKEYI